MRALIADDYELFRSGLRQLLVDVLDASDMPGIRKSTLTRPQASHRENHRAQRRPRRRERGCDVMIVLHNVGFHPAIRAARFDVCRDMIIGMARSAKMAAAAPAEVFVEHFDLEDDLAFA